MPVQKRKVSLHITQEAYETMLGNGYCTQRGIGGFLSELVMRYHYERLKVQQEHDRMQQELEQLRQSLLEAKAAEAAQVQVEPTSVRHTRRKRKRK